MFRCGWFFRVEAWGRVRGPLFAVLTRRHVDMDLTYVHVCGHNWPSGSLINQKISTFHNKKKKN